METKHVGKKFLNKNVTYDRPLAIVIAKINFFWEGTFAQ